MAKITIYTAGSCYYCHAAKALLQRKGAAYDEIDVSYDPAGRQRMTAMANGKRTVPQIFIGETHIGDCDELYALDRQGRLDPLLAGA
jgi:glutaredoxin 3